MELEAALTLSEIHEALTRYIEDEKGFHATKTPNIRFVDAEGRRLWPSKVKFMVSNKPESEDDF